MVRTQIQLTERQAKQLKRLAARRQVSMAALVREAVDRLIEDPSEEARWQRALGAVGRFRSAGGTAAEDHDRYLEEAYLD
jgi:Arc/MetJ-type ribon-helix-helix transcriptional regulator